MFPPEAIQVIEQSQSRVVILDPPYYSFGAWVLFLGLITLAAGIFLMARNIIFALAVMSFLLTILLFIFGSYLVTNRTQIVLSREDGLLRIQKQTWGFKKSESSVPIAEIRQVTVENLKYSRILTVVMRSGATFNLGNGSSRDGYHLAADAINGFLGAPTQ